MEKEIYDLVIIGSGPSGLTCGIYATRSNLKTLILEKGMIGGQASLTNNIDNYPALNGISGFELMSKMFEHATSLGVEFLNEEVLSLELNDKIKKIILKDKTIETKAIVLALGAKAKKLNVKGEEKFLGKGVAYCAVCDGGFYKNKSVVVVGGGNSAVEDAIYLSNVASSVTVVSKKSDFTCNEYLKSEITKLINQNKIKVYFDSVIYEIKGDDKVNEIVVKCPMCKFPSLKCDGVFVAVGRNPDNSILTNTKIELNSRGYVVVNSNMETNIKGVFACGDVIDKEMRQIITACADGAVASNSVNKYIRSKF